MWKSGLINPLSVRRPEANDASEREKVAQNHGLTWEGRGFPNFHKRDFALELGFLSVGPVSALIK
jgi:hypothetical protein